MSSACTGLSPSIYGADRSGPRRSGFVRPKREASRPAGSARKEGAGRPAPQERCREAGSVAENIRKKGPRVFDTGALSGLIL